jgi:hypothetical protein
MTLAPCEPKEQDLMVNKHPFTMYDGPVVSPSVLWYTDPNWTNVNHWNVNYSFSHTINIISIPCTHIIICTTVPNTKNMIAS